MTDETATLLTAWRWTTRTAHVAHLRATDSLSWRSFALGGASAILGAIVGLGIFATLQSDHVSLTVRILAGIIAALAAALAALYRHLDYATRVRNHITASRAYAALVREMDQELLTPTPIEYATVTRIREQLDAVDTAAPNVSPAVWTWAVAGVAREREARDGGDITVDASTLSRGARSRLTRLRRRLFV
jgi:hypothetical protein